MMVPKGDPDTAYQAMMRAKCPVSKVNCYQCSGKGHYKADFPSPVVPLATMANEEDEDGAW